MYMPKDRKCCDCGVPFTARAAMQVRCSVCQIDHINADKRKARAVRRTANGGPVKWKTMPCENCSKIITRTGSTQKYCRDCAALAKMESKRRWCNSDHGKALTREHHKKYLDSGKGKQIKAKMNARRRTPEFRLKQRLYFKSHPEIAERKRVRCLDFQRLKREMIKAVSFSTVKETITNLLKETDQCSNKTSDA